MKKYDVILPISGTLFIPDVEAENEDDAIENALNMGYDEKKHDLMWTKEEYLVKGNVFYGELNEAEAQESEE